MTEPVDLARARELPAALLELLAAMASGNEQRKTDARAAVSDIINS